MNMFQKSQLPYNRKAVDGIATDKTQECYFLSMTTIQLQGFTNYDLSDRYSFIKVPRNAFFHLTAESHKTTHFNSLFQSLSSALACVTPNIFKDTLGDIKFDNILLQTMQRLRWNLAESLTCDRNAINASSRSVCS